LTVEDLDRSAAFFRDVLMFEKAREYEVAGHAWEHLEGVFGLRMRAARMRLGGEEIELREFLTPKGRPYLQDTRANVHWFQHVAIIVSDMDAAYAHLRKHRVQHASPGPQRLPDWNPNACGIEAFYFRDPDGHFLEVLRFSESKGDPRWHQPYDKLFLGIEHTAIVVGDTEESLKFYRDRLGLAVKGESENYGPEQERLNNVFGARLRITAMRAGSGAGVEFLEYLTPGDGRPEPADARANDVAQWQTRMVSAGLDRLARMLQTARVHFVSPGAVTLPEGAYDYRKAMLLRDTDGHLVELVQ
jgi:catechol 2,3-dioxygenase-like lactoylglutathione lyase family enzyme